MPQILEFTVAAVVAVVSQPALAGEWLERKVMASPFPAWSFFPSFHLSTSSLVFLMVGQLREDTVGFVHDALYVLSFSLTPSLRYLGRAERWIPRPRLPTLGCLRRPVKQDIH